MKTTLRYSGMIGAVLVGLTMVNPGGTWAQSAPADEQPSGKDTIIVTGTRVSGLSAADSPAPVQVIGADILGNVGQPDMIQALAQNIPSFNAQAFGGDTANLTLSAKLRGLSPNHALVLINGKRRHGTSNLAVLGGPSGRRPAADLNFVPLASVDHIEVLLEGAAASTAQMPSRASSTSSRSRLILAAKFRSPAASISRGTVKRPVRPQTSVLPLSRTAISNLTAEARYHGFSNRGAIDPRVIDTPFNTSSSSRLSNYPGSPPCRTTPTSTRSLGMPNTGSTRRHSMPGSISQFARALCLR